jgi:hypothetical protein
MEKNMEEKPLSPKGEMEKDLAKINKKVVLLF